ncbi:MAG: ATP phosphoribosyltransferase [Candidatus Gastranaerophilales bacterium]|nr:ATP phosphoribosyltransferase [Candidatus Gastranaerophilales bacterium]
MDGLKIAIPNKGRMSDDIFELLKRAGLNFEGKSERTLNVKTENGKYEIVFVRTKDIPNFVHSGACDIGFTGQDVVYEAGLAVDDILTLDFGHCKMVVAVKEEDSYKCVADLPDGIRLATSFPNVAKKYFAEFNKTPEIVTVSGATEIMPRMDLVDVIVDITSSGSTLKANKLKIIGEIFCSSAVVIGKPDIKKEKSSEIEAFVRAVKSALAAKEKKYLMAHIPKSVLDEVKSFLPGLSSPTVTTLHGNDNAVVVHVVVDKNKIYESVDKLKKLGASGILILTVDQMIE